MPSLLRRYTPPTCTLEVTGVESPLSRWSDRPVARRLRFRLRFDDPRLEAEQQVMIEGDRAALETLSDVVEQYVQNRLGEDSDGWLGGAIASPVTTAEAPSLTRASLANALGLSLQPQGALSHVLSLGQLAPHSEQTTVSLTTLQIFDLASALEEWASDMVTLPPASRPAWLQPAPGWLRGAAVLAVALGTTLSVARFIDPAFETGQSIPSQSASSEDQQYGGIAALSEAAESELSAPRVDPDQLEPIPSPPPSAEQEAAPSPGMPRVTVPSQAPIPPIASAPTQEVSPPAEGIVPPNDLPPAVTLPSPTGEPESSASQALEANPTLGRATLNPEEAAPEAFSLSPDAQRAVPRSPSTAPGTAFDVIPQVAEVRSYFEQRWQPPEGLTTDIQYSLILNPDGTLQRAEPLGQAASTYLDRTGIPLSGEPLTSALSNGTPSRIRLVLSPDGRVQTFLENR
jgi:hypothetical protein